MSKKQIYELDYPDFRVFVTKGFEEGYGKTAIEAYEEFKQGNPDKAKEINMDMFLNITEDDYKDTIQMAIRQGKSVPENILKEYPELAKDKSKFMKVRMNRKILSKALANIKPIVSGRHPLAMILSSILISAKEDNTVEIIATDLETGFKGAYPAKVIVPGDIVISHKELSSFVSRSKSDEILITEKEKGYVAVSNESASFDIFCMNADDFPTMPEEIVCKKLMEIDLFDLKSIIDKSVIIKPTREIDEKKPHIIGASFKITKTKKQDYLRMASTNGGTLVEASKKISVAEKVEMRKDILVPKSGLRKLNSAFLRGAKKWVKGENRGFGLSRSSEQTILFGVKGDFFIAQKQNETVIIRLLEGTFPDYKDLITRKKKNIITADRNILLDTMRQMAIMQNDIYCKMTVNIEKNILKMIFTNPDLGEMKKDVSVQYAGGFIEALYCPSQFVDFLSLMESDMVSLDIKDKENPCLLTGKQDKEVVFVIMPWPAD
jgi:DNA polymerase-3 subunit beta